MTGLSGLFIVLLTALVFPTAALGANSGKAAKAPVIKDIRIHGNTRTRSVVIERELLFSVGQHLDSSLVKETARNLRRLFYLGNVEIDIQEGDGWVILVIQVEDLYARALSPLLSGEAEELSYGGVALDYNFLGRGQIVQLTAERDAISGNYGSVFYENPRVMGTRQAARAEIGAGSERHEVSVSLTRSFRSLSDRWAHGVSLGDRQAVQRRYIDQDLAERYTDRQKTGLVWVNRSYGDRIKLRPSFQLSVSDRRFSPDPGFTYAPIDRKRVLPGIGVVLWRPGFEKRRFIRGLGRTEDLQTGSWISVSGGISSKKLGSDSNYSFYRAQISPRFSFAGNAYAFLTFFVRMRRQQGKYANLYSLGELLAYVQIWEVHTFAIRFRWDALDKPEDNSQLLLGVDRGLRGYRPRRFDGSRRILMNLEARPIVFQRPGLVLAGAFFADGGTAWAPGRSSPSLQFAVGMGVRVNFTRIYDNPILRADLAYGIQDRAWQVSVGLGQYF